MRLFGKVDGAINRYDRAGWMTPPFDMPLVTPADIYAITLYVYLALISTGYIEPLLARTAYIHPLHEASVER